MTTEELQTLLPQNIEAERCLLSCFMASPKTVGAMLAEHSVTSDFFHRLDTRTVAVDLLTSWAAGLPCDQSSVIVRLRTAGTLADAGGQMGVNEIAFESPIPSATNGFLKPVIETHRLRRIHIIAKQLAADSLNGECADGLIAACVDELGKIGAIAKRETAKQFPEMVMDKMDRMVSEVANDDIIRTGITKLDRDSPMRAGDMPLIAGERKAGKSILALTIARYEMHAGNPVLYFSLEDHHTKVIDRIFAAEIQVPIIRHHQKHMTEAEMQRAEKAVRLLTGKNLMVRDKIHDLNGIVATIRQEKAKRPNLRLAIVDYAQLVKVSIKGANREQEVASISRAFRSLSLELDVAIPLLSQLNKDGESRESKALEQDCTAMWKVLIPEIEADQNTKRIIAVPFQRNGDGGIGFPVSFRGHFARIDDLDDSREFPEPPPERRVKD